MHKVYMINSVREFDINVGGCRAIIMTKPHKIVMLIATDMIVDVCFQEPAYMTIMV